MYLIILTIIALFIVTYLTKPDKGDLLIYCFIAGSIPCFFILAYSLVVGTHNMTTLVTTKRYDLVEVNKYVATVTNGTTNFAYVTNDEIISESRTNITFIKLSKEETPFVLVSVYDSSDCHWVAVDVKTTRYEIHCNPSQIKVKFTN